MNALLWFCLGATATAFMGFLWWCEQSKREKKRILLLTEYLEAASIGKETILPRAEDSFSILEDEIGKTVGELRVAREQAQKERKQQADNLADIAHQLKTPLTSMSLMTQLLGEEALPQQQEYIKRLHQQFARLEWLTSSLLTMSRLDAGTVEFVKSPLLFETLAMRCSDVVEEMLASRQQMLHVEGGENILTCDLHWTAEAIINLIKNASEHSPPGGRITLLYTTTPLYQQIVLEDSGEGFFKEEIPFLFQRFYRGKNVNANSVGIGLALSRAIVEGQDGVIYGENSSQGGARFVVRFYP